MSIINANYIDLTIHFEKYILLGMVVHAAKPRNSEVEAE